MSQSQICCLVGWSSIVHHTTLHHIYVYVMSGLATFVAVRWLVYILGIYLLALSVCPCLDAYEPKPDIGAATEASDAQHAEHSDICSPLCVCSCCGSILTNPKLLGGYPERVRFVLASGVEYPNYQDNLIPSYLSSIWHPPRMSPC